MKRQKHINSSGDEVPRFSIVPIRYIRRYLSMVWAIDRKRTLQISGLRIYQSVAPFLVLFLAKEIIDLLIFATTSGIESGSSSLWLLIIAEGFIVTSSEWSKRLITIKTAILGDIVAKDLSVKIIEQATKLDLQQFENAAYYDQLNRAKKSSVGRIVLLTQVMDQIQDMITVLVLAIGMITFFPIILPILLLGLVPLFWGETKFDKRTYSLLRGNTPARRELEYIVDLATNRESAKEVRSLNLADFLMKRYLKKANRYLSDFEDVANSKAKLGGILSTISTLVYYSSYLILVNGLLIGTIASVGTFTFLVGSYRNLFNSSRNFMLRNSKIITESMHLGDLFEFLDIMPLILNDNEGRDFPSCFVKGIEFRNVGFRYPNSDSWAVRNISFHIRPGEKVALVGNNGAGKSTIVKLLCRLYDPTEGEILIDGFDLKSYKLNGLRKEIAVLFQDFVKYEFSVKENIGISDPESIQREDRLRSALMFSGVDVFLNELRLGFDQQLGTKFDSGQDLSGGQWQKIAIARTYFKQSHLMILDEPSAALDPEAEALVFDKFNELAKDRTAMFVTHRLSSAHLADMIIVIQEGSIKEMGSIHELLDQNGTFSRFYQLQSKGFQLVS